MTGVRLSRCHSQREALLEPNTLFHLITRVGTRGDTPRRWFPQKPPDQRRSTGAYIDHLVSAGDSATARRHRHAVERTTHPLHESPSLQRRLLSHPIAWDAPRSHV